MNVYYINMALSTGKALFAVPAYYVLNTVLCMLGGLVYFNEWLYYKAWPDVAGLMFGLGGFIAIIGVGVISYQERNPERVDLDGPDYEYDVFDDGESAGALTGDGEPGAEEEGRANGVAKDGKGASETTTKSGYGSFEKC